MRAAPPSPPPDLGYSRPIRDDVYDGPLWAPLALSLVLLALLALVVIGARCLILH